MSPMPPPPPLMEEPVRIEICDSAADLHRHAASLVVAAASRALGARARFHLAVSGCEALWPIWDLLPQPHYAYQVVWPAVVLHRLDDDGTERIDALASALRIPETRAAAAPAEERFDLALVAMDHEGGLGSLSLPIERLNDAALLCVLVSGEARAAAARRVLGAGARPEGLPAQSLRPAGGRLLWLLDQAAASGVVS